MLIEENRRLNSGRGDLPIVVTSVDGVTMLARLQAGDLAEVARLLSVELERLNQAGAAFAMLAPNSVRVIFDELQELSPVPLVSIVEAAAEKALRRGLSRLFLLGTTFVTQGAFYPAVFAAAVLELVVPTPSECAFVHERYVEELLAGRVVDTTVRRIERIIDRMRREDGIEVVVLARTELSLITSQLHVGPIDVLDTTEIHVRAAIAGA